MLDQILFSEKELLTITPEVKCFLNHTRTNLKGTERRQFMARVVLLMGKGGQTRAKNELGWEAEKNLDDMCKDTWNWQKNNPDGYRE